MIDENRGYKKHAIVKVIEGKTQHWLKSIKDETLREEVGNSFIVTGGCIASMLMGEAPNDYDYYFTNKEVVEKLTTYYFNIGESKKYKEGVTLYHPRVITPNAISLSEDVQLITRFVGGVTDIHKNFDFAHCVNYYTRQTGLVLNQQALECILAKELKYVGSIYPVSSIFRMRKFLQRGWQISAAEMLKIAFDVSKLNLSDPSVLQEQMIGVDIVYFTAVIDMLEKDEGDIERTHLFDVLDQVFEGHDTEGQMMYEPRGVSGVIKEPSMGNVDTNTYFISVPGWVENGKIVNAPTT